MIFLLILILIYLGFNLYIYKSFKKNCSKDTLLNNDASISIVIAARNEASNLPDLINSLIKLQYPKDRFEAIIVDDNSDDGTFQTAESLTKNYNNISVIKAENKLYDFKRGALDIGINHSRFPNILITDADCTPSENWLSSFSSKFKEGYDFIFGAAPFYHSENLINKISRFENLRSFLLTITAAENNLAYSASARNFGFKKDAFEKIGGYEKTADSISGDDDLLLREAVKNNMKIGFVYGNGSNVFSKTKENFQNYFQQKRRHTAASFHYLPKHILLLALWHLTNILILLSPIFTGLLSIFLYSIKFATDYLIIKRSQKYLNYSFTLPQVIYLQIFYEFLLVINFFNALLIKDRKW